MKKTKGIKGYCNRRLAREKAKKRFGDKVKVRYLEKDNDLA